MSYFPNPASTFYACSWVAGGPSEGKNCSARSKIQRAEGAGRALPSVHREGERKSRREVENFSDPIVHPLAWVGLRYSGQFGFKKE